MEEDVKKVREWTKYFIGIAIPVWLSIVSYGILQKEFAMEVYFSSLVGIFAIVFLVSIYHFAKPWCEWRWRCKHRTRLRLSVIGILTETDETREDQRLRPEKSRYFPDDWEKLIQDFGEGYNTRPISVFNEDSWDNLVAIINPYGEMYPEEDIGKKKTFDRIKKYVERGG
ncbi:MAG: hypothetical protein ACW96U_14310, partial [Candidatus Heimdallarchaeaceae archaeon]